MKNLLLLLIAFAVVLAGHHGNHKCVHDKINEKIADREVTEFNLSEDEDRHLQSIKPRKMKISYDMSFFNRLSKYPEDQLFYQVAEKAINISIKYLSDLLTVIPKPISMMKWDKRSLYCGEASVPQSDVIYGQDSDLHLYVTFTDEPEESYLAYAGWCRFLKIYGPTHGQVNFNKGILSKENFNDPIVFQDFIQTTIHEIIHVLGFSSDDIYNWVDANKKPHLNPTVEQRVRGTSVTFIRTPNVLKAAREYYGCSTLPGMPVENQGDAGSAGSHWETSAILDEMMNPASSATTSIMTIFTTALLRDTGFYYSVNSKLEEPTFYGKDEGCGFLLDTCSSGKREFCQIGAEASCDYYYHGTAQCRETFFTDSGCSNWQAYRNSRCFDEKHYQNTSTNTKYYGVGFGHNSKCFVSSLYNSRFRSGYDQPLCYKYECTVDQKVIVKVGEASAVCSANNEKVTVSGFSGTLTCPSNIAEFCGYKKLCPKHCSSNGYCSDGVCLCSDGYTGVSCNIKV